MRIGITLIIFLTYFKAFSSEYRPTQFIQDLQVTYSSILKRSDRKYLRQFSALIIPENKKNCVFNLENSNLICSKKEIIIENQLFGMWYGDVGNFSFSKIPDDIFNTMEYPTLAVTEYGLKKYCAQVPAPLLRCAINILAHEGFHMVKQMPNTLAALGDYGIQIPSVFIELSNKNIWPKWAHDQPENLQDFSDLCYSDGIEAELKAVISSLSNSLAGNRSKSIEAAKRFINLRDQRYKSLSKVKISILNKSSFANCKSGEQLMEITEGVADFEALSVELEIKGNHSLEQFIDSGRFTFVGENQWYYRFGSAQLFLLQFLFPEKYLNPVTVLTTSKKLIGPSDILRAELKSLN